MRTIVKTRLIGTTIVNGSGQDGTGSRTVLTYLTIQLASRWDSATTVHHTMVKDWTRLNIELRHCQPGGPLYGAYGITPARVLRKLADDPTSQPVGDRDALRELAAIKDRWGGHASNLGCAHQEPIGANNSERRERTPPCPETGYKFGTAWLVEELPADIEERLRRIAVAVTTPA